jgi:hypothetical protein
MKETNSSYKQNSSRVCWRSQVFTSKAVSSRVIEGIIIDFLSHGRNIYDIRFGDYISEGICEMEETVSIPYGFLLAVLNRQILLRVIFIFLIIGKHVSKFVIGLLFS